MRLYPDEKQALERIIENIDGEVYLFGSRVDDHAKGGDINILVYTKQNPWELSRKISREFFLALESKLDAIVFDKDHLTKDQKVFVDSLQLERLK